MDLCSASFSFRTPLLLFSNENSQLANEEAINALATQAGQREHEHEQIGRIN